MKTVFGKPAVEVPQPSGELLDYLIAGVTPTDPRVSRVWVLTSPKGKTYTVREYPGWWQCDCPAFRRYARHGCKHVVGSQRVCKHIAGIGCPNGRPHGHQNGARPDARVADPARTAERPRPE